MKGTDTDFPVFVVGAPRSGTTLVYSLLMASGDFVEYEEGETRLLQCRDVYGPLNDDRCFQRFAEDWLRSKQFRRSGLSESAFENELRKNRNSYVEVLRAFMCRMAESQGRPRWAEKTPANIHHMRELANAFPEARFVHVIRDGRDVALSRRKLGWHVVRSSHPLRQLIGAARHWSHLVVKGRERGAGLADKYIEIRYEDLIENPEEEGLRLSRFVGSRLSPAWNEGSQVGALGSGFSAFSDEVSGLDSSPVRRWRQAMTEEELVAIVAAAGPTLSRFGYDVEAMRIPLKVKLHSVSYGTWVDLVLGARRLVKNHTPLRRLRAPNLLDFETDGNMHRNEPSDT